LIEGSRFDMILMTRFPQIFMALREATERGNGKRR
jgi:hypothetical protein